MNIGIVTTAYNGYGRFLVRWCLYVSKLNGGPFATTVLLGKRHGCNPKQLAKCVELLPHLKILDMSDSHLKPRMGMLRNWAIDETDTDWVVYISCDDKILPHAVEEYSKYQAESDYICARWLTVGLGQPRTEHVSPLPELMATHNGKGFVIGHSPFRRSFWEKTPYENHDYPNAPFLAAMVENGARFVQTERPCTVYLRRSDSHARTVLPKKAEKRQAVHHKLDMERRIKAYYA